MELKLNEDITWAILTSQSLLCPSGPAPGVSALMGGSLPFSIASVYQ